MNGNVFLSHSSKDKSLVDQIYKRLDASGTFYDIKTINPGGGFTEEMKRGISESGIFVLFHSPNTKNSWVEFEVNLAEIENIKSKKNRILVCPINGETHNSLPDWMKSYMTTTEQYTISDISRSILHILNKNITQNKSKIVGREEILDDIHLSTIQALPKHGRPLQHIVLSGIPGMGRTTVASKIISRSFSMMRQGGPIFDLPDMAEAVDFYIALKEDLDGIMSKSDLAEQIQRFSPLSPEEQAKAIALQVDHWSEINQPIVFKTRWGLRDRSIQLKPWLNEFFRITTEQTGLRVIYVSERRLPDDEIAGRANIAQFAINEVSQTAIQVLLNNIVTPRYYDSQKVEILSRLIGGHPATAHHTALLLNAGRNADTLTANPDPIMAFQAKALKSIFSGEILNETQIKIISLLGVFPKLSFRMIHQVLEIEEKTLSNEIWELIDFSLLQSVDAEYFSCPDMVATHSRTNLQSFSQPLLIKVRSKIEENIEHGEMDSQLVSALLIAAIETSGEIPEELSNLLTSSSLLAIVRSQFDRARSIKGNNREEFASIYKTSKLAMTMRVSDDAIEQILFTGGDSAIRAGIFPKDIIDFMERNALPSVYYLRGSYEFHVSRDMDAAIKNLRQSLSLKHFKLRNIRLLAKAYIRNQKFSEALETLNQLGKNQIQRETGLLILKIRALRGLRLFTEATELEATLKPGGDEYGEVPLFRAGRYLREMKLDLAQEELKIARDAPKVNQLSCQLLECAVRIEAGDASLLPATVEFSNAVNRHFDAFQLQARHAVVEGRWVDAERFLSQITRKDYFDLQIEKRCLELKITDKAISRDLVAVEKCKERLDEVARLSTSSPEGYRDA
ncbi:TIR domain-containing protein [Thalassospira sp. A3_1]|uniref:TIR domain-containing protein n=1 Tax=Thalassospira sp. A3_1 TaxID=2821088 RepID=UPI001ADCD56C|nr:TIR domain-containing protein [Thalassospira sp. A3_1]MBO9509650.1 TIR domain-containing protein [Thalassospira sp. A3_1]